MQLGGLYKKATYLGQYRASNPGGLVVVDSGDLLNEDEEIPDNIMQSAKLKAELITQVYKYIGIDAVNVGELDLVLGIPYLKELEKKNNFPFISANLVDEKNAPLFKPYVIKKVNGKNVGIFGIMGDTSEMTSKISEITKGAVTVKDGEETANAVLKELSGKVDYVIALTHQTTTRDWVIARRVKGVDLVVGGHDKQRLKEPSKTDTAFIVRAGEKGQYQGFLEVSLDNKMAAENKLVPFDDTIANDPKVKDMIFQYNEKVAAIYAPSQGSKPEDKNVALRLTACEACHPDQVKKWKTTDHAKAYQTLVDKKKNFEPKCLGCHTVRFEQPEGFNMKQQQMELVNVQCESCHGFAKEHLSDGKPIPTKKPAIALCIKCHTTDRCPTFEKDAEKVMAKIKH